MRVEIPKAIELEEKVFALNNEKDFASIALDVYHFQFNANPVYQDYCTVLGRTPDQVRALHDIPFLPISFFKSHRIETTSFNPELVFKSSGTTGAATSTHYVKHARIYRESFRKGFSLFYGDIRNYCILGLLPSYLERTESSLVYMVKQLVEDSGHRDSGFYLNNLDQLDKTLDRLENSGQPTLLLGVTFALLDFSAAHPRQLKHTLVMETGGMKGRRKELVRAELYETLKNSLGLDHVHSEYGMTALLSQAYGVDGRFRTPGWMKVLLRDETDPLSLQTVDGQPMTGALNIIDLANLYSCSFIATEDVGKSYSDGSFEVLGRMDNSDIRGCSQLAF